MIFLGICEFSETVAPPQRARELMETLLVYLEVARDNFVISYARRVKLFEKYSAKGDG